jgi:hypothetical protein
MHILSMKCDLSLTYSGLLCIVPPPITFQIKRTSKAALCITDQGLCDEPLAFCKGYVLGSPGGLLRQRKGPDPFSKIVRSLCVGGIFENVPRVGEVFFAD